MWRGEGSSVMLRATRCAGCARVIFPPQSYGCEWCGSAALEPVEIEATGTLRSFAAVPAQPPYTIGEVALDAGRVLNGLLSSGVAPSIGMRVRGVARGDRLEFE